MEINSVDSGRVFIRYAEQGGGEKEGLIEVRRGVDDISLGAANYAQVRIGVDGKYYMKGMCCYGDIPDGYDIVYNTFTRGGKQDRIKHYPDEYSKFKASEEASVQMMTELICKKLGIIPTPSQYQRWIDNLKEINSKAGLYTSEDDFIKELYEKDPRDRYSWLFKNVHDKIDSSATMQEQYEIGLLLQEFEPIK